MTGKSSAKIMKPQLVTRVKELVISTEGCSTYQRTGNTFRINNHARDIQPKTTAFIVDVVCATNGITFYEVIYSGGSDWVMGNTRTWLKLECDDVVSS